MTDPASPSPADARRDARRALFADRNFRWLVGGGALSMLGDQFTLIALPWLVLRLSDDPLVLGTVLAVASLPRALLILVGGALVDRHSPRAVLMRTKLANAALVGSLAVLAWHGHAPLLAVYALAFAIGLVTAFSYPAGSSILPQAVPASLLGGANGMLMALRQFATLLGPLAAGGLIAAFGDASAAAARASRADGAHGLALAFAIDAASFLVSAWTLGRVKLLPAAAAAAPAARQPVRAAIAEAIGTMWRDVELRSLCLYFAAVAFFVGGPIQVALPVLVDTRLPGGAGALGLLLASQGTGALLGMALAGMRPDWRLRTLGLTVLAIDATGGLALLPFGHLTATWQGIALLAPLGMLAGFVQVAVFTWMQRRVPPAMLGRAMSVFMFLFIGVSPLAAAAAGAALHVVSLPALFTIAGLALLGIVGIGLVASPMPRIDDRAPAPGGKRTGDLARA